MIAIRNFIKNNRGQGLVEFALILPILLILILGIMQFGFIFNGQITLNSAARDGARLAVVNTDDELVKDRVEEIAVALFLTVDREDDIEIKREIGDGKLNVKVDGNVGIIMPFLGIAKILGMGEIFEGDAVSLSADSTMRIEIEN